MSLGSLGLGIGTAWYVILRMFRVRLGSELERGAGHADRGRDSDPGYRPSRIDPADVGAAAQGAARPLTGRPGRAATAQARGYRP